MTPWEEGGVHVINLRGLMVNPSNGIIDLFELINLLDTTNAALHWNAFRIPGLETLLRTTPLTPEILNTLNDLHIGFGITEGSDIFLGNNTDDLVAGLGGNDLIFGGEGNDVISDGVFINNYFTADTSTNGVSSNAKPTGLNLPMA